MRILYNLSLLIISIFLCLSVKSQNIGINGTGASPDASAMLDVSANDKGLLIPRVPLTGTTDITTITGAATSLLVYNTASVSDVTPGFYYWNGTLWVRLDFTGNDWTTTGNAGTNVATNFIGTTDGQHLAVVTNNTEAGRFTTNNRLGINLPNPSATLHVGGHAIVGPFNPVNTGTLPGFGNRIYFEGAPAGPTYNSQNSDPLWMARYNVATDQSELRLNLSDNCSSIDQFVIQAGGSGCAANTPVFRFGASGVAEKPGGGAWTALSDQRLKKNIQPFSEGLTTLTQINPVTFEYNGKAQTPDFGKEYIGVIAQEMEVIAPYTVQPSGEYLSVDPSAFTYILINSVKEQQEEIEALKEKVTEMENLRAELLEIKEYLGLEAKN